MSEVDQAEIHNSGFKYSAENPPPLEVLESKIFAVHATPILPKDGVLKAGAIDISYDKKWQDEPPSFRPTIHFALGELVREHQNISWDKKPFAVVIPIKALESQLINVFPHDTFVLGDYKLTPEAILLVPRGTNVSTLSQDVQVVEYGSGTNLRQAVDQVIRDKNGWSVRMEPEGVTIGSVAYVEDAEINSADFFQSLLERFPHISFGTHLNSERGDAFRFGLIEQGLNQIMRTYSGNWFSFSTIQVQFHKSFVTHNLIKLEAFIKHAQGLTPGALRAFEDKKQKLAGWMNIIDADMELRVRLGKTLSGAPKRVQKQIQAQRYDSGKLRETVGKLASSLPNAVEGKEVSCFVLVEMLHQMSPDELKEFMAENQGVFNNTDLPRFFADYAVNRWVVVKDKKATDEGLDVMLAEALPQITLKEDRRLRKSEVFSSLREYLTRDSNRVGTALNILQQPSVRKYLTEQYGFNYPKDGLKTLEDVLHAHPDTRLIFKQQQLSLSEGQQTAYSILKSLGIVDQSRYNRTEALESFDKANSLARELKWSKDKLGGFLEQITQPMSSTRESNEIPLDGTLGVYERLRRDNGNPSEVWKKLGLEEQFRRRFPNERAFWQSRQSLLDIYKLLKSDRSQQK